MSDSPPILHLSPSETAKALGLTVRALRVYEAKGLVHPMRSQAGWRAYGPQALERLHQVLTLKRLGLRLAEIAVLLTGRLSRLDAVLALQEEVLARRADEAGRSLALVRSARARIAAGRALSLDDLAQLTRETTMDEAKPDWARKMQPIVDRHFSEADKAAMAAKAEVSAQTETAFAGEWEALIAEAQSLLGGDPGAPAGQDLARRWMAQVGKATGGDPALTTKIGQVWQDSFADPHVAPTLPFGPEVWAFVNEAVKRGSIRG